MHIFTITYLQIVKTTPIRRVAVREAGVSRQSRVPNWGHSLNPSYHHSTIVLRGSRGALDWASLQAYPRLEKIVSVVQQTGVSRNDGGPIVFP